MSGDETRRRPWLSVVVPTLNAAATLPATLAALRADGDDGVEVIVADGGSCDGTPDVAARSNVAVIAAPRGRGAQLAAGARAARGDWLLFVHADTVLGAGWRTAAEAFSNDPANAGRVAAFRFVLDLDGAPARRLESYVAWRARHLGLPYGDQGLLVARAFYERLGGFAEIPIMEDVDMIRRARRAGGGRPEMLDIAATTSARRYRSAGVVLRGTRNLFCLALYFLGVPPRMIVRLYG